MRTIRGQLLEIANKEVEALGWVATGAWPDDLDAIRAETFALIDSLDDGGLRRPIPNPEGWWEALRLPECPFDEILRNVATHEGHLQRADLRAYLGTRGQNPHAW